MSLFFRYQTELPQGVGFALFGPKHLAVLAGMALVIIGVSALYGRTSPAKRAACRRRFAWFLLALEAGKDVWLATKGHFDNTYLPLHLCGLAIFVSLADAYFPSRTTHALLYFLCMPGALAALLFPNWTQYPVWNIQSQQSFWMHGLLMAYPIMQLAAHEWRPALRDTWRCLVFLLIVVPPIYLLNRVWNTNYMFVNVPSPGSPLVLFAKWFGNPGYLAAYLALLLAAWLLLDLPWALSARRHRGK